MVDVRITGALAPYGGPQVVSGRLMRVGDADLSGAHVEVEVLEDGVPLRTATTAAFTIINQWGDAGWSVDLGGERLPHGRYEVRARLVVDGRAVGREANGTMIVQMRPPTLTVDEGVEVVRGRDVVITGTVADLGDVGPDVAGATISVVLRHGGGGVVPTITFDGTRSTWRVVISGQSTADLALGPGAIIALAYAADHSWESAPVEVPTTIRDVALPTLTVDAATASLVSGGTITGTVADLGDIPADARNVQLWVEVWRDGRRYVSLGSTADLTKDTWSMDLDADVMSRFGVGEGDYELRVKVYEGAHTWQGEYARGTLTVVPLLTPATTVDDSTMYLTAGGDVTGRITDLGDVPADADDVRLDIEVWRDAVLHTTWTTQPDLAEETWTTHVRPEDLDEDGMGVGTYELRAYLYDTSSSWQGQVATGTLQVLAEHTPGVVTVQQPAATFSETDPVTVTATIEPGTYALDPDTVAVVLGELDAQPQTVTYDPVTGVLVATYAPGAVPAGTYPVTVTARDEVGYDLEPGTATVVVAAAAVPAPGASARPTDPAPSPRPVAPAAVTPPAGTPGRGATTAAPLPVEIARTGARVGATAGLALVVAAAGGMLVVLARRQRRAA
ncbi:hypothetical protein GC089_08560 [Cellulomonas sp. JZ18]|nr:hypothetical protein GC089_08560 [Cellulomonas sp. JZ18]